jgi:septum formation protein
MERKRKSPLILASASPRRQELLESAGIQLEIMPSNADEKFEAGEGPEEHVIRLANAKAMEVARKNPDRWILAADTVVVIDGKVLGKPGNPEEAKEMLQMLSGQEHRVITGYCIYHSSSRKKKERSVISQVRFKPLSAGEIQWYIDTEEPYDKAGAYAVQGKAAFMVKEVHGSYTNVVGLPLCEVVEDLRALGAIEI